MIDGAESSSFGFSYAMGNLTPRIHSHILRAFKCRSRPRTHSNAPRYELQPTDRSAGELTRPSQEADCGRWHGLGPTREFCHRPRTAVRHMIPVTGFVPGFNRTGHAVRACGPSVASVHESITSLGCALCWACVMSQIDQMQRSTARTTACEMPGANCNGSAGQLRLIGLHARLIHDVSFPGLPLPSTPDLPLRHREALALCGLACSSADAALA